MQSSAVPWHTPNQLHSLTNQSRHRPPCGAACRAVRSRAVPALPTQTAVHASHATCTDTSHATCTGTSHATSTGTSICNMYGHMRHCSERVHASVCTIGCMHHHGVIGLPDLHMPGLIQQPAQPGTHMYVHACMHACLKRQALLATALPAALQNPRHAITAIAGEFPASSTRILEYDNGTNKLHAMRRRRDRRP